MKRRQFLALSSGTTLAMTLSRRGFAKNPQQIDATWYKQSRRFVDLPQCRVAYVERGRGPAALFLHGFPLNGFQWRGALERLHTHRRCLAPDLMSMGFTETPQGQPISPATQVDMLAVFLDNLRVRKVDLVANDSGGLVAQLFLARFPDRVRTLLLTNCDVDENNPPPALKPIVELSRQGLWLDKQIVPLLENKQLFRTVDGVKALYRHPESVADETIETYWRPITLTPLKKAQLHEYAVSMGTNQLVAIREDLRRWQGPARMVWGMNDVIFDVKWAEWLDHTLPGSRGVRRLEDASVFFPEEKPEVIAEEAVKLWESRIMDPLLPS